MCWPWDQKRIKSEEKREKVKTGMTERSAPLFSTFLFHGVVFGGEFVIKKETPKQIEDVVWEERWRHGVAFTVVFEVNDSKEKCMICFTFENCVCCSVLRSTGRKKWLWVEARCLDSFSCLASAKRNHHRSFEHDDDCCKLVPERLLFEWRGGAVSTVLRAVDRSLFFLPGVFERLRVQ